MRDTETAVHYVFNRSSDVLFTVPRICGWNSQSKLIETKKSDMRGMRHAEFRCSSTSLAETLLARSKIKSAPAFSHFRNSIYFTILQFSKKKNRLTPNRAMRELRNLHSNRCALTG